MIYKKLLLQITLAGVFIIFSYVSAFAQQSKMDSLLYVLQNAAHDTTRLKIYFALCNECDIKDNLKYAEPALKLADKLISQSENQKEKEKLLRQKGELLSYKSVYYESKNDTANMRKLIDERIKIFSSIKDTSGIVFALLGQSGSLSFTGNIPKALEYCQKALDYSKKVNYQKGIALSLGRIGNIYRDLGEPQSALKPFLERLTILETLRDTEQLAHSHLQMGNLYSDLSDTSNALIHYRKGKHLYKKIKRHRGIIKAYIQMGEMYTKCKDYDNAIKNYSQGLILAEKKDKHDQIIDLLNEFGWIYYTIADYNKALDYYLNAYELVKIGKKENLNNIPQQTADTYIKLGLTYFKLKNYSKAKEFSGRYLNMVIDGNYSSGIFYGEKFAMQVDSAMGNYKGAFEHYKQYIAVQEKLNSEEVKKKTVQQKYQNEYEEKQVEAKAIQDKKDLQIAEEKQRQTIITYSISAGFLLVVLFAGFIFRSLNITRKQKQIIEEKSIETEKQKQIVESKNKEITDSIIYAKRIQQAILPSIDLIYDTLKDSFILYKPKDVVSGDFYEFVQRGDDVIIAIADCTGHGVPGAFMSMIGNEQLTHIIIEKNITQPAKILDELHKGIRTALKQDKEGETRDGMDIALCKINLKKNTLEYAGAMRPFWIFRHGQLLETKANKQPIGGLDTDNRKPFTNHEIQLHPNDCIYLFTDGYADQFGGSKGKKFMLKKFESLLSEINFLSMQKQGIIIGEKFEAWKGINEQVDDVLVLGIKI